MGIVVIPTVIGNRTNIIYEATLDDAFVYASNFTKNIKETRRRIIDLAQIDTELVVYGNQFKLHPTVQAAIEDNNISNLYSPEEILILISEKFDSEFLTYLSKSTTPKTRGNRIFYIELNKDILTFAVGTTVVYNENHATVNHMDDSVYETFENLTRDFTCTI